MTEDQTPVELDLDDLAPDADEPGDNELPLELQDLVHDGDIVPDNLDEPTQHEQFEEGETP